eukprot:CAMPEP_0176381012 /NCGR_PEP_ID=MMETSP0126-20121128/31546_1 /TAXON_ID=141414 ORGANISM="Strombidinopsis acuminatum, Strain SPMC142" /NCGR_SAMPLE_ID=MMETSP0126 /ASSEMBLY_ACC=CAM_ASM_000229 /LENGTH=166 /DNA_ID=CAMNT_0017744591 /DNA_START=85 /DNA_END=585 /DNA_ORIENTATION=+
MAYNVAIGVDFMPVYEMGERPVMRRNGIEFDVRVRGFGEFRGRGHLVLTTRRLIIVNRCTVMPAFKSFSFPLVNTHREVLKVGLMGRFHVDAHCRPHGGLIPTDAIFKIWFNQGGALIFQHIYKNLLIRSKMGWNADQMMMEMQAAAFQQQVRGFGPCNETTLFIT